MLIFKAAYCPNSQSAAATKSFTEILLSFSKQAMATPLTLLSRVSKPSP
jgi:hypothetical protein